MIIDKNFNGLVNVGWRYEYQGNISTTDSIKIDLDMGLYVYGAIEAGRYIKAGGSIEAGWYIKAGGSIEAVGSIKAGGYIEAGGSIEAGRYIEAGGSIEAVGSIEAGWYIKSGRYIEAGGSIEAGRYIEAGSCYGISAGLEITAKTTIYAGLKIFAGICAWREIEDNEKTITCSELIGGGTVESGILKETGEAEKKKVTLELTDEQLNKIKKIISEV
jgi:UDP-3-O-[3-hydroxymyristoyl] glucosamine N-acyltransferase